MFANFFVGLTLVALLYPLGLALMAIKEMFVYGLDPAARRFGKVREVVKYFLYEFGLLQRHPVSKRGKYRRCTSKPRPRTQPVRYTEKSNPLLAWPITMQTTVDPKTNRLRRDPWVPDVNTD